jgi:hypothetical protein
MILKPGDRVLAIHRRLFESDHSRFFVGTVAAYQDGICRVTGYTFARDNIDGNFCRKQDARTKLLSLSSGTLITYCLPDTFDVDNARLDVRELGLCLTDGSEFALNISEWVHKPLSH